MNSFEQKSFVQCCKMLQKRSIFLLTFTELDTSVYDSVACSLGVSLQYTFFDKRYFDGIDGYNLLMLNYKLYDTFRQYDYMFVYQLDAYIFYDDLESWCVKGYDYVGAPWFEEYGTAEEGHKLWAVGNGGLSLRKVSWWYFELKYQLPVKSVRTICRQYPIIGLRSLLRFLPRFVGKMNRLNFLFTHPFINNEDNLCRFIQEESWRHKPKTPCPKEAAFFSFEKSPSFLYEKVTNKKLPMACHAWNRYEYETFWKRYMG